MYYILKSGVIDITGVNVDTIVYLKHIKFISEIPRKGVIHSLIQLYYIILVSCIYPQKCTAATLCNFFQFWTF